MGRTFNNAELANELFYELTKEQLKQWKVNYHELLLGKPAGDIYIDDKGINDGKFFKD